MGMWGFEPWDNDTAADWYTGFMQHTGFREQWLRGIHADLDDYGEEVRAAAHLFVQLGRPYIWPIENYAADLELSIEGLHRVRVALLESGDTAEGDEWITTIDEEIAELRSRR